MLKIQPQLNAPIAGMSLTHKLGDRPWQKPPMYPTVEEAIDYYVERFQNEDVIDSILDVLSLNVPVTTIANSLQTGSVMEGKHTVDVGMLVIPVLMEMIMYIGDKNKVKYETGLTRKKKPVRNSTIAKAIKELKEDKGEKPDKQEEEVVMEEPKGLMARRDNSGI